jgi:hypothetical protein
MFQDPSGSCGSQYQYTDDGNQNLRNGFAFQMIKAVTKLQSNIHDYHIQANPNKGKGKFAFMVKFFHDCAHLLVEGSFERVCALAFFSQGAVD